MITISSSISAALIAIATFALTNKLIINHEYTPIMISIALAIGMGAVWLFIWSYCLRRYQYPLGHEIFFRDRGKGDYNKDKVNEWRTSSREKFNDRIIEEYLSGIKTNSNSNIAKARLLEIGQLLFFGLIPSISIWLVMLFVGTLVD